MEEKLDVVKEQTLLLKETKSNQVYIIDYLRKINDMLNEMKLQLDNLCLDNQKKSKVEFENENTKHKLSKLLTTNIDNYKKKILNSETLKKACIKCKLYKLSGQQTGPLLEKYIIQKYNLRKELSSDCVGDCSSDGTLIEIKTSLGGIKHDKFNYVQIRISHNIDLYILIAYYLSSTNVDELGELFIFKIPKNEMKSILSKYGGYAHGTISKNGEITLVDLNNKKNNKEYAIRPKYNDKCWNELQRYRVADISI
jgi:hypothetical protein